MPIAPLGTRRPADENRCNGRRPRTAPQLVEFRLTIMHRHPNLGGDVSHRIVPGRGNVDQLLSRHRRIRLMPQPGHRRGEGPVRPEHHHVLHRGREIDHRNLGQCRPLRAALPRRDEADPRDRDAQKRPCRIARRDRHGDGAANGMADQKDAARLAAMTLPKLADRRVEPLGVVGDGRIGGREGGRVAVARPIQRDDRHAQGDRPIHQRKARQVKIIGRVGAARDRDDERIVAGQRVFRRKAAAPR